MKGNKKKTPSRKPKGQGARKPNLRERAIESADMSKDPVDTKFDRRMGNCFTGKQNDVSWYTRYPQLLKDFGSLPFGYPIGMGFQMGWSEIDAGTIPGVMSIGFVPSIGVSNEENAPINLAMRDLYSYVRHANSGSKNYDAPDMMLMLIAMDSVNIFLSWMKRIYGIMRNYTVLNYYYPRALLRANGLSDECINELQGNIAQFRGYINMYAAKFGQLWMPNTFSFLARHNWMCEGIYLDSTTAKAQTYMYVPDAVYQFTLTDGVGSCQLVKLTSVNYITSMSQIMQIGNSLLDPIVANEDFGLMSGDILKAFGQDGIYRAAGITDDYQVLPVYNAEVLSQMENATLCGSAYDSSSSTNSLNAITQNTEVGGGYLVSNPTTQITILGYLGDIGSGPDNNFVYPLTGNRILNFHHENPTPEDVMVSTRLMAIAKSVTFGKVGTSTLNQMTITWDSMGTEICTEAYMWSVVQLSSGSKVMAGTRLNYIGDSMYLRSANLITDMSSVVAKFARLSAFDWHPIIVPVMYTVNGEVITVASPSGLFGDLDCWTYVDKAIIKNLHQAAIISELSTPHP